MNIFHSVKSLFLSSSNYNEEFKDLAYWLGVSQSDGYFKTYTQKNRKSPKYSVRLIVSKRSLPMLEKFHKISKKLFKTNSSITNTNRNLFRGKVYITRFMNKLKDLDIKLSDGFVAPNWIIKNKEYFGSYLAGIIDGDGNVRIKRPKYPQCAIRIFSGKKECQLIENLRNFLGCSILSFKRNRKTYFQKENRVFNSNWYTIEFLVSSKNYKNIRKHVVNNLALDYKRNPVKEYIDGKIAKGEWSSLV